MEAAILNGDHETGVSIMQLSAKMDAGPVYGYTPLELTGTETRAELYDTLGELGTETLLKLLPLILEGEAVGLMQNEQEATYCQLLTKADSVIDWNKSAARLEREIRAYAGWPQSRTTLGDVEIIITKAHVTDGIAVPGAPVISDQTLSIGTADQLLAIDSVKPLGKKEMPVGAFLAGYKHQLHL